MRNEFLRFLVSCRLDQGASENTVEAYRRDLDQFYEWAPRGLKTRDVEHDLLNRYISHLYDSGMKPSSIARKISALRQFFKFCCLELSLERNPAEHLDSPGKSLTLPKGLDVDRVNGILAEAASGMDKSRPDLKARDEAMLYLLYATGLRVSELLGLTLHEVDLNAGFVRVRGKREKQRIVPFASAAGDRLRVWIENYRPGLQPKTDHVFLNHRGGTLSRQAFWKLLKSLARAAGVPEELVSPHVFRHAFATHLLESGMNLRTLQLLLGHADLSTTQIYTQVSPAHLKEAHRKFHPRG